jgi:hypothetical protein
MNRQAFRDDLAAQRIAIFGYDPARGSSIGTSLASHLHAGGTVATETAGPAWAAKPAHEILADIESAVAKLYADSAYRPLPATEAERELMALMFGVSREPVESEAAPFTESMCDGIVRKPAIPVSYLVDIKVDLVSSGITIQDFVADDLLKGVYDRPSDLPGIAAMAAKSVKAAPEPVVSLRGEPVFADELAEALEIIRARKAPPDAKEAPRGLLCMPETFDHRLGAWGR